MPIDELIKEALNWDLSFVSDKENVKARIEHFIRISIHSEAIKNSLSIKANLKPQQMGMLLYVLTKKSLIKFEIEKDGKISSSAFFLKNIVSIERKMIDHNTISVDIVFPSHTVGLSYPIHNSKVALFFESVGRMANEYN